MSTQEIKKLVSDVLSTHKFAILTNIKKVLNPQPSDNSTLVHESLLMVTQHHQLQMLCYFSYKENSIIYAKYENAYNIEQLLKQKRQQNLNISDIDIEFLCLYDKNEFQFTQIVQKVIQNNRLMYQNGKCKKINRELMVIPQNAIMKDGKKYSQTVGDQSKNFLGNNQSKGIKSQVPQNNTAITKEKQKQQQKQKESKQEKNKPTKTKSQLPRLLHSKIEQAKTMSTKDQPLNNKSTTQVARNANKRNANKPQPPNKKLRLQSSQSQSQDYYVAQKFMVQPAYNSKLSAVQDMITPQKIEIQNQGNYLENHCNQKMEIQEQLIQKNNAKNIDKKKELSPQTQEGDEEDDDMDDMFKQMDQKLATQAAQKQINNNVKQSIGAKSVQPLKPTKTSDESNKSKFIQPPKTVANKQGSLFGWMGKKN